MPFKTFLGVENNQGLIREYEIIDGDFEHSSFEGEEGKFYVAFFIKYPRDDCLDFFGIFTLKEYFIHIK